MQDHRRLRVWRKAVELAISVRRVTARYPRRGYGELKAQTISAAESIVNNIVEGCGASSQREFARFLEMSIKSNKELEGELELAAEYGILSPADWAMVGSDTIDVRRMLIGLRKKVLQLDAQPNALTSNRNTQGTGEGADPHPRALGVPLDAPIANDALDD